MMGLALAGCTALQILPTILMGATLPVLYRFYVSRMDHLCARTGWLYGINTLGATVGAVLCGLVLIRFLGVRTTPALCAGVNGLLGISCLVLARFSAAGIGRQPGRDGIAVEIPHTARIGAPPTPGATGQVRWALILFGASGFCSMAYDVIISEPSNPWMAGLANLFTEDFF